MCTHLSRRQLHWNFWSTWQRKTCHKERQVIHLEALKTSPCWCLTSTLHHSVDIRYEGILHRELSPSNRTNFCSDGITKINTHLMTSHCFSITPDAVSQNFTVFPCTQDAAVDTVLVFTEGKQYRFFLNPVASKYPVPGGRHFLV